MHHKLIFYLFTFLLLYNSCFNLSAAGATQNTNNESKKEQKKDKINSPIGIFTGSYKNDGVSGEFDGLTYPHSREMLKVKYFIL